MRFLPSLLFACILSLPATASALELPAGPALKADLPNFAKVSNTFYRGAQPTRTGFSIISQLNIRTVLNLRDDPKDWEKETVESVGLRYIHMPMSALRKPRDKDVSAFLKLMRDASAAPLFIHCQRGADRTGVLSAIRRIEIDGWTALAAANEMVAFRGRSPALVLYVFQYYKRRNPTYVIPDIFSESTLPAP